MHIKDKTTEFLDANDYWGKSSFETEEKIRKQYGPTVGILSIGQAGENLVKFATIVWQKRDARVADREWALLWVAKT